MSNTLNSFRFLEAIVVIVGAFAFLTYWVRTRFWLPKYIHVLAAIGLIVSALSEWASPADAPIKQQGWIARLFLVLVLPAIIYAYFILHGGQHAAFKRSSSKAAPCPFCGIPIQNSEWDALEHGESRLADSVCPHCSHPLASANSSGSAI